MVFGMHGVLFVGFNLLLVATITAFSARLRTVFWRWCWPVLGILLILAELAAGVVYGGYLLREKIAPQWFFGYALTLFIFAGAGSLVVLRQGLRAAQDGTVAATGWNRLSLLAAVGLAFILNTVLLEQLQTRTMVDLVRVQCEATGNLMSRIPVGVPEAANARLRYESVIRALAQKDRLPGWFSESLDPVADPASPKVVDFLAANRDMIDNIKAAAAMPAYGPDLAGANFTEWPLPDISGYRRLGILLNLEARSKALSGNVDDALQVLSLVRNLAGHLDSGPFIISHALANLIDGMRLRSLEFILAKAPVMALQFSQTVGPARAATLDRLNQALCREAQGQLQGFAATAATADILSTASESSMFRASTAVTRMWRAYFLPSDLSAARDIITHHMCLPAGSFAEIQNHLAAIDQAREAGQMGILSAIGAPGLDDLLRGAMRHDALEKLAAVALAATAFRDRRGRWPDAADNLDPAFMDPYPTDPFDGKPIKMKQVAGGVDLFSVGPPVDSETGETEEIHFYLGKMAYENAAATPTGK